MLAELYYPSFAFLLNIDLNATSESITSARSPVFGHLNHHTVQDTDQVEHNPWSEANASLLLHAVPVSFSIGIAEVSKSVSNAACDAILIVLYYYWI